MEEAKKYGGVGVTGVSFDVVNHGRNVEFIALGSTVHKNPEQDHIGFSTSADAQQLYCQMDSEFDPLHFVFGNVAYSIGVGGNISGAFRSLGRGEVPEFSNIFDQTRHLALSRIVDEAKKYGANAVIGIKTTISPLMATQEMMMVGTASRHPALDAYKDHPVTSDMTNEEMWNMVSLGYLPIQLVMGVSVYSLGLTGGIVAAIDGLLGGEVSGLTELLYEAREKALARIEADAERCGADEVIGVKTRVYHLGGGLVEFMAIGTAVKKFSGIKTKLDSLPPQAIIKDQETFIDMTDTNALGLSNGGTASARSLQQGPIVIFIPIIIIAICIFILLSRGCV